MRVATWLRLLRRVGRRGDALAKGAIATMAVFERCLGPALVSVALAGATAPALAVGAVLSVLFGLRGVVQSIHLARTEAALYERAVDSALRQDVLQTSVL